MSQPHLLTSISHKHAGKI